MKLVLTAALAATLMIPRSGLAQPEARDITVARREFAAGIEAARASDWERARVHFARSYEINPRMSALFNLAGAQAQTGELVEAAESYREYLGRRAEAEDGNVLEAERLLAELEARIPTVRVTVTHLEDDDEIALDDSALNRLLLDSAMPLNPGSHTFAVRRAGAVVASESIEAVEGARLALTLNAPVPLPEVASAAPAEPEIDLSPAAVAAAAPPEERSDNVLEQWWLWTIVGSVVVAGVVVAIVLATTIEAEPPGSVGFQDDSPVRVP